MAAVIVFMNAGGSDANLPVEPVDAVKKTKK